MTYRPLFLIAVGGCGRLGFDPMADPAVRSAPPPASCLSSTLAKLPGTAPPVDLTATATDSGATVLWTLPGGGLWGVETDSAGQNTGEAKQLRTDNWIQRVAMSNVDHTTIAAVQDDATCIAIDVIAPGLGGFTEPDHLAQHRAGRVPTLKAGPDRIAATASDTEITITPFDASWNPLPNQLTIPSSAASALAATELGGDAIVAWSTPTTCELATLSDMASSAVAWDAAPCALPRLAASTADVALTFEATGGVYFAQGQPGDLRSTAARPLARGTAPRVVFDGTRYWLSYLDPAGMLAFGYLDDSNELVASTLGVTSLGRDYELIVMDGSPWLVAASNTVVTADELCIPMP